MATQRRAVRAAIAAAALGLGAWAFAAAPVAAQVRDREGAAPPADRDEGLRLFAERRYAEAEAHLDAVHARRANDLEVMRAIGIIRVERGRDRDGIPLLERVLAARPGDLEARAFLGVGYYHLARYDAAIEVLESVLRADTGQTMAASYLGLARRNLAQHLAESRVEAADAALARGDDVEAEALLEDALAAETSHAEALDRLRALRARRARTALDSLWTGLEATFEPAAAGTFVDSGLAALAEEADPDLARRVAEAAERLAAADLEAGRAGAAAERLERVLAVERLVGAADRARLHALLGRSLAAAGDVAGGLAAYDRALDLDPAAPVRWERRRLWLRRHAVAAGAVALAALAALAAAAHAAPRWTRAGRRRARLWLAARAERDLDFLAAAEHLEAYLALAPDDETAPARLAEALRKAGQRGRAVEAFRAAIERAPDRPALRRGLAETLRALGRNEEALEAFRGLLHLRLPATERAAAALEAAGVAAELERHDEAVALFEAAFAAGAPRTLESLRTVARSLAASGRTDEANAVLKEILRRSPAAAGDILKEYQQIFRTRPDEGEIHLLLARHFQEGGDHVRAAAEYEAAAHADADRWGDAVECHRLAGALDRAVEAARRWAAAAPASRPARRALVEALLRTGQAEEAAEVARTGIAADGEDLETFRLAQDAARELRRKGDAAAARSLLEAIVEATPFDATEVRIALGEVCAEAGEHDRAIETVQRIERGGAGVETRTKSFVASCWIAKGMPQVALQVLGTLDLRRPGVTVEMRKEAQYWRARAAEAVGDLEGAVRGYDEILQADIRFRDAYARREALIRTLAGRGGEGAGTVACPRCGVANRPDRKFCGGCGAPLEVACPACGAANEPAARFCGSCGGVL